jgi:hypothetical protein
MSTAMNAKAERLLAEGRVDPINEEVRRFRVEGDTGIYDVILSPSFRYCSCPATADCSHVRASIELWYASAVNARGEISLGREHRASLEARKAEKAALADDAFARLA